MQKRERTIASEKLLEETLNEFTQGIIKRLDKHGPYGYISTHECYGVIAEEMHELLEAIKSNNQIRVQEELLDVAVAALFSIVSLKD